METIPSAPNPVTLTEKAVSKVIEALEAEGFSSETHRLRVGVLGGGCSGLQYMLDFTDEINEDYDMTYEQDSVRIVVDPVSASHLAGTTIDYMDGLMGSGFKFLNDKKRSCGCGMSFS